MSAKLVAASLVVLALAAAACGSDQTAVDSEPEPSSAPTTAADPGPGEPPGGSTVPAAMERVDVVSAVNQVGWALWADHLGEEANAVISPSSIGHTLLMARDAGDTATVAAIDQALGFPAGLAAHEEWQAVDEVLTAAADAEEEITVTLANRIWPRLGVEPDPAWMDLLSDYHRSDVEPLDFARDADGSRETISGWVDDRTEGLIPDLLPHGFITGETVLVLTDALYFKAPWAVPFGKYGPVNGPFTRLDGSTVDVEFMQELDLESRRGSGDGYVGAEVPYAGGEYSMLVIVPDEGRFAEIRDLLGDHLLDDIDAAFTVGPFELLLPPWEDATEQLDLLPWLESIGAAPGSYPGISPDAFLGAAVHGADITVDEWGTVAAAATAFGFETSAGPEPTLTVAADQPFLYLIRHVDTSLVLFLGQVTDPSA